MALDILGTTITADATNPLKINNGLVDCLVAQTSNSYTHIRQPSSIYFIAANNLGTGWVDMVDNSWNKLPMQTVQQNTGSGYDTTNSRFIAPLEGYYLFTANSYLNKMDANIGSYGHPMFLVNGSSGLRRPYGNTMFRMRGYGLNSTYSMDGSCEELIYLYVGDYVEYYIYSTAVFQVYYPYLYFSGWYIG